ncbi:MAG: RsmD family RNA methyltransferase, partial [Candidatus Macondimonas sp.]
VFVDPPFADQAGDAVLAALARTGAVRSGGKVYVEAPQGRSLDVPSDWTLWREGRAGEIVFRVFITSPSTDAAVPGNAAGEISDARLR